MPRFWPSILLLATTITFRSLSLTVFRTGPHGRRPQIAGERFHSKIARGWAAQRERRLGRSAHMVCLKLVDRFRAARRGSRRVQGGGGYLGGARADGAP